LKALEAISHSASSRLPRTKDSAPERLLQAIDVVLKGEYFLDSAVSQKMVQRLAGIKSDPKSMTDAGYETLTSREQEIFVHLAEGHSLNPPRALLPPAPAGKSPGLEQFPY
jgi:DNA-binding NarL/FixJ family response regulator